MNYEIIALPSFKRKLKKLVKKHNSLKDELTKLFISLQTNPEQGFPLGNNCYEIRLAISSKGKGKSGGARVITNIVINEKTVFLLSIYDKSEKENLTDKELIALLKNIPL